MVDRPRIAEGADVDAAALDLFAKVAGWGGRTASRRVNRILNGIFRNGVKVLDVGTGPGTIPLQLQRMHGRAFFMGLDISLDMLRKATANRDQMALSVSFLSGDGESLPFCDQSIDVVTSFFALHHMDRPDRFLAEADRVLKPDGRLLIIDFRRDMSRFVFGLLNTVWQLIFFFSSGRFGFRDSVLSAWRPDEIETFFDRNRLNRFDVHTNGVELWIVGRLKRNAEGGRKGRRNRVEGHPD